MSTVADRYAKALFEAATAQKLVSDTAETAGALQIALSDLPDAKRFFANPLLENSVKEEALLKALKKMKPSAKVQKILTQFISVMAENGRLAELSSALKAFVVRVDADAGRVTAKVKTASALSAKQKKDITAWVKSSEKNVKDVVIAETVDPSVIAGLEVRVGSKLYDATAAGRLNRLKTNLNVSN